MDPVTHTVFGATLGDAGLKRWSRLAMPTLVIGANLPDVDAVTYFLGTTTSVAWRRGITHGVLALVIWPFVLTWAMAWWNRRRPSTRPNAPPFHARQIFWLACLSIWLHPTLDFLNNYGMRWFMPFSDRWYYGDTLFIIDPFVLLVLVGARTISSRLERAGRTATTWPRAALVATAVYVAGMAGLTVAGRAVVSREMRGAGVSVQHLMVGPVPGNPFRKDVIVEDADRYYTGSLSFVPTLSFTWQSTDLSRKPGSPLSASAIRGPESRNFLSWARFPYFVEEHTADEDRVIIGDMRFPSAGPASRLGLVVRVPHVDRGP